MLVRRVVARRRATILLYHAPAPETLERHLQYLSTRYRFVSLDQIVDAIRERDFGRLPDFPLAITVDDGHRSNYECLDVFRRYHVRPTIYLCSQVIDTTRPFWFNVAPERNGTLKRLSNRQRLEWLAENYGYTPDGGPSQDPPEALDVEQLLTMKPVCDFGSHTRHHPILTTCDDLECKREIVDSKVDLEHRLSGDCNHFSYPNGDYGEREREAAEEAGYMSARTVDVGWNGPRTDPYRLRMMGVTDDASINMLSAQLTGAASYMRQLRAGSWTGRYKSIELSSASADA